MFVTNNSTKSRKQYADKFLSLGISVSEVALLSQFFFCHSSKSLIHLILLNQIHCICRMRYSLHPLPLLCTCNSLTSPNTRRFAPYSSFCKFFIVFLFLHCLLSLQVYVIGEQGILEELQLAGFTALGGPVSSSCLFSFFFLFVYFG